MIGEVNTENERKSGTILSEIEKGAKSKERRIQKREYPNR